MWSIGIDVHQRKSQVCILDENGKPVKQTMIHGTWTRLLEFLERVDHPFAVCYEASCGYGHLYDKLRRISQRVVVAHPGQLRLIFRSKQKSDRCDARKLATLLFLDQVPPVYVPSLDVRSWRQLIEFRPPVDRQANACQERAAGAVANPRADTGRRKRLVDPQRTAVACAGGTARRGSDVATRSAVGRAEPFAGSGGADHPAVGRDRPGSSRGDLVADHTGGGTADG